MSALDLSKLEKAKHKEGGIIIARCPACAEQGHDKTGEICWSGLLANSLAFNSRDPKAANIVNASSR